MIRFSRCLARVKSSNHMCPVISWGALIRCAHGKGTEGYPGKLDPNRATFKAPNFGKKHVQQQKDDDFSVFEKEAAGADFPQVGYSTISIEEEIEGNREQFARESSQRAHNPEMEHDRDTKVEKERSTPRFSDQLFQPSEQDNKGTDHSTWDTVKDRASQMGKEAKEKASNAEEYARQTWDAAKDKAQDVKDRTESAWHHAKDSANQASKGVHGAMEKTIDKAHETVEAVKSKAHDTKESAAQAWENTKETVSNTAKGMKDEVSQIKDKVEQKSTAAKEYVEDNIGEKAKGAFESAKEYAAIGLEKVGATVEKVGGTVEKVGEKIEKVGGAVKEKFKHDGNKE